MRLFLQCTPSGQRETCLISSHVSLQGLRGANRPKEEVTAAQGKPVTTACAACTWKGFPLQALKLLRGPLINICGKEIMMWRKECAKGRSPSGEPVGSSSAQKTAPRWPLLLLHPTRTTSFHVLSLGALSSCLIQLRTTGICTDIGLALPFWTVPGSAAPQKAWAIKASQSRNDLPETEHKLEAMRWGLIKHPFSSGELETLVRYHVFPASLIPDDSFGLRA